MIVSYCVHWLSASSLLQLYKMFGLRINLINSLRHVFDQLEICILVRGEPGCFRIGVCGMRSERVL